jgi:WD40 repeat protein
VPLTGALRVWTFSPDGRFLACGDYTHLDRTVWLVPVRAEKPKPVEVSGAVTSDAGIAWLEPGNGLVVCGRDGALRVWIPNGNSFAPRDECSAGCAGPIRAISVREDGGAVVTVSRRSDLPDQLPDLSALTVWHQTVPARSVPVLLARGWFRSAVFLPDGSVAACGTELLDGKVANRRRGFVKRFDGQSGTVIEQLSFDHEVVSLSISKDGRVLAALAGLTSDRGVQICQTVPLTKVGDPIKAGGLQHVALSADGKTVATAGARDQLIKLWAVGEIASAAARELTPPLKFGKDIVPLALAFSPDGKQLASPARAGPFAHDRSLLHVWDLASARDETNARAGPKERIRAVAWSPDGRLLATASDLGVTLWKVVSLEKVTEWSFPGPVNCLAFHRNGTQLVTGNANGTVSVLDVDAAQKSVKKDGLRSARPREVGSSFGRCPIEPNDR